MNNSEIYTRYNINLMMMIKVIILIIKIIIMKIIIIEMMKN
jgi:hypothetical protein